MRIVLTLVLLAITSLLTAVHGAPVDGAFADKILVGGDPWKQIKRCKAGERSSVQIVGLRDAPPSNLKGLVLSVFDAQDKLIGQDKGSAQEGGGFMAVSWHPPREAEYRIEVRNESGATVDCYITIK